MLAVRGSAHADNLAGNQFDGFVYVLGAVGTGTGPAAIEAYGREHDGGKLDRIGRFLTGGQSGELAGGQQHGLATQGRYVYAVNASSNTVSVLLVGRDGKLSLVQQISSGGLRPASIAIHGNRLYINNTGHFPDEEPAPATIVGYTIRFDGSLARLPCEPAVSTPGELGNIVADLAVSPNGTSVVTSGLLTNRIDSFHVDLRGCLTKRESISADGGGFGVLFRPNSDNAVVTRAVPEVFGEDKAPGIGSFRVGLDSSLTLVDAFIDADKSDEGLRDPCWGVFAKDGSHLWIGSFIPRSITAFNLDSRGKLTRLSEHHPTDTIDDPSNPGSQLVVGAFDLATDSAKKHLYQIRGVGIDGNPSVPHAIHAYEATGNWSVNAGLREVSVTPLPTDAQTRGVPGLVFVDRPLF
jgi:hypothetical protein